jgi:hypothetical protein
MKLTKEEAGIILPMVMRLLRAKATKNNPLYGARIVDFLNFKREEIGFKNAMTESRLRKCINYIRTNGLMPVIADEHGYYITKDPIIIRDMAASLRRRTQAINAAAAGLEDLANKLDPKEDIVTKYVSNKKFGRNEDVYHEFNEYIYVGANERDLH